MITLTNQILLHNNGHVKALYRRGIAERKLKRFDEAIRDFELAGKMDNEIKDVVEK